MHFPVGHESLKEAQLTSNAKQDKLWKDPNFDTELDGVCSNTQLTFEYNANTVCILTCLSSCLPFFGSFIEGKANSNGICRIQLIVIPQTD